MVCEKGQANMERMEEQVSGSGYRQYQHFLSNSSWDHVPILHQVARDMSAKCEGQKRRTGLPIGLIVDESATVKKGKASVGVGRQYAGVVGKVENCQVGVYASLCHDTSTTLVNERLFLPDAWANDSDRCKQAGIPEDTRQHQTKPQLALEMIDELDNLGLQWDWIGGDGLYGHSYELTVGLDERELLYVLDVHKDELIYETEPQIAVPPRTHAQGRTPTKRQADREPIRLDHSCATLSANDWERVKIRKGEKGWLKRYVHIATVWVWNEEEDRARRRTVVISKTLGRKPKTKYSVSNGTLEDYTIQEYAYFQAQRYWVERCFDDAKNELGLSDYQVRKWQGWHHHHALVMMASLFVLKERLAQHEDAPLMSLRDARLLIIARLFGTDEDVETCLSQMHVRHDKRQKSIDWWYIGDKE
ncbi:MAG: IS701 family transposase [bacterium]|nr:IS701 family transposase [bacterium]